VDITYFESGYIDDTYFIYTANAEVELSSSATVYCFAQLGNLTRSVSADLSSQFTFDISAHVFIDRPHPSTATGYTTTTYSKYTVATSPHATPGSLYIPDENSRLTLNPTVGFNIQTNDDFVIEGFFYFTTRGTQKISIISLNSDSFNVWELSATNFYFTFSWNNGANSITTFQQEASSDIWHYVKIFRRRSEGKVNMLLRQLVVGNPSRWNNGSLTVSDPYTGSLKRASAPATLTYGGTRFGGYFDEWYIARSAVEEDNVWYTGQVELPAWATYPWAPQLLNTGNLANTQLLQHFDGDFVDDIYDPFDSNSVLLVTATANIRPVKRTVTGSTISTRFTLTAQVNYRLGQSAALTTQATVYANIGKLIGRRVITGTIVPGPALPYSFYSVGHTVSNWTAGKFGYVQNYDSNYHGATPGPTLDWGGAATNENLINYAHTGNSGYDHTRTNGIPYHFTENATSLIAGGYKTTSDKPSRWIDNQFYYSTYVAATTNDNANGAKKTTTSAQRLRQFDEQVYLRGNGTSGRMVPFGHSHRGSQTLSGKNYNEWTWSFWFKYSDNPDVTGRDLWSNRTLMGFWSNKIIDGTPCTNPISNVQINGEGRLQFINHYIATSPSGVPNVISPGTGSSFYTAVIAGPSAADVNITDGYWHHIVCSGQTDRNNSIRTIKLRIDGQSVGTDRFAYYPDPTFWPTNTQEYGFIGYNDATDFWLLPNANVVKNNYSTFQNTEAWWSANLARDPIQMAEVYWIDQYQNLDQAQVLQNFYQVSDRAVDLGGQGEMPTGTQALVYHKKGTVNLGSIGDFEPGIYAARSSPGTASRSQVSQSVTLDAAIAYWDLVTIVEFDSPPQLTSAFTQQANLQRIRTTASVLQSAVTAVIQARKNVALNAQLESAARVNAITSRTRPGLSQLQSTATVTTSPIKTAQAIGAFASQAQVQITNGRIRFAQATLSTQFTQVTNSRKSVEASAEFAAMAAEITVINKIGRTFATLNAASTLQAQARTVADRPVTLTTTATLSAQARVVIVGLGQLQSTSQVTCSIDKVRPTSVALTSQFTVQAQPSITRTSQISAASQASVQAEVKRTRATSTTLSSQFTLAIAYRALRLANANLISTAGLTAETRRLKLFTANLQVSTFEMATITVQHIDPALKLRIRGESRGLRVHEESRLLGVKSESRVNIIQG
jgi:hypothetical protein